MKSISYNNTETHRAESLACTADHRLSLSSWRCKPSLSNRRDKSRSHLIWHIRCSVHTIQDELVDLLQQMIDITHSAVGFGDEDRLIRCVLACRPTPDILLVPTSLPKRPLSYLTHFMALQSHSKLSRQLAVPRCPRIEAQQAANANKGAGRRYDSRPIPAGDDRGKVSADRFARGGRMARSRRVAIAAKRAGHRNLTHDVG